MKYYVGNVVLETGDKAIITWSDGTKTKAVYTDTFGYSHMFLTESGKELRLANRYMQLKGITITKDDTK